MTEIEKKFIACLIKQKVTSFKMSLCQHSETPLSRDVFVILIQLLLFCNRHTR